MSPQGHQTARTTIYVIGGLVGLSLVGGIVAFVVVANEASNMANQNAVPAGTGATPLRSPQINQQLMPAARKP
jgi:hypothetical protein